MQVVKVSKGKYIVAVSGGVDSMALLDMLRRQPELELVVAHVDHGIRTDSAEDEKLVHSFCMSHNIEYVNKQLHLSKSTSEDVARIARYDFLRQCRINYKAKAIVTAHHQDDLVETVIINLLRGTGWRGLAPFNQNFIIRPLLKMSKNDLINYASAHKVPWREDSTNSDQTYLRNYVRHSLMPAMGRVDKTWRASIMRHIRNQQRLRRTIEKETSQLLSQVVETQGNTATISRHSIIMLPDNLAYEMLQALCRQQLGTSLVRNMAEALVLFTKVAKPAKRMPLTKGWQARVTKVTLIVEPAPSMVS